MKHFLSLKLSNAFFLTSSLNFYFRGSIKNKVLMDI